MVETVLADDGPFARPPSPRGERAAGLRAPEGVTRIGESVVIEGEVKGSENIVIDGKVDGMIDLQQHVLTISPTDRVDGQVVAKSVVVLGQVNGSVTGEKVSIAENGSVEGVIAAPRVVIADGAHLQGRVEM